MLLLQKLQIRIMLVTLTEVLVVMISLLALNLLHFRQFQ